jgi:COMPASS component BRE2
MPATGQQAVDVVQQGVGAVNQAVLSATDAPPTVTVDVGMQGSDTNGTEDHHMSGLESSTALGQHDEDVEMT